MWKVYLLKFTSLDEHNFEEFYKIGVTSTSIEERFAKDLNQFKIETLALSKELSPKVAFDHEKKLHNRFKAKKYVPINWLYSGGSTECFKHVSVNSITTSDVFGNVFIKVSTSNKKNTFAGTAIKEKRYTIQTINIVKKSKTTLRPNEQKKKARLVAKQHRINEWKDKKNNYKIIERRKFYSAELWYNLTKHDFGE